MFSNLKNLFETALEPVQAKLEESNIFGIGSKEDRDLRKLCASSDKEWKGAGKRVGLEIWRVENRRTEDDKPLFGIKRWPKEMYGSFHTGDSYIILNTYKRVDPLTKKKTDAFAYDLHFWLGSESSQDEKGVAAYKTVELDTLLDDLPIQYRETQYYESTLFQSYFKELIYLPGGIESGFRKVKPVDYKPQLFLIRSSRKSTRAYPIPVKANHMNHGDCFVLDCGLKVYKWVGEGASPFERNKAGLLQSNITNSRNGKAKKADIDESFWTVLGGTAADVRSEDDPYLPKEAKMAEEKLNASEVQLFRISDEKTGKIEFTLEGTGELPFDILDSNDVFLLVSNVGLFLWMGNNATQQEKSKSMSIADDYIKKNKLPNTTTVTVLREGNCFNNHLFSSMFTH